MEKTPAEIRADMSRTLLVQMAASTDPQTREHANFALTAQGLGPNGQPVQPAGVPAPVAPPAAAPVPLPMPQAAPQATTAPPASPAGPSGDQAVVPFDKNIHGLGKYSTPEQLKNGYFNAVNALSQATDELVRLRNQTAAVNPQHATLPGSAPGDAARVNPTQRTYDPSQDIAELVRSSEESGQIDPQMLANTVATIASRVSAEAAKEAIRAEVGPMQAMAEAETYMRTRYPDSVNHAVELENFVKLNPVVGSTVMGMLSAGQYKGAMEYAWSMYTVQNGISVERGMVANSQIAEEERLTARAAAGFSGSPNTGVHAAAQPAPPTAEEMAALNERAKTDSGAQVVRRRILLGNYLPPEWRTWENQGQ